MAENSIDHIFYRNHLKVLKKHGVLSPYFNLEEERYHFSKLIDKYAIVKVFQSDIEKYLNEKEKKINVRNNQCLYQKDRQSCCKANYPTNDFLYFQCVQQNLYNGTKLANYILQIILLLLINILLVLCYILPRIGLYKL